MLFYLELFQQWSINLIVQLFEKKIKAEVQRSMQKHLGDVSEEI